MSVILLDFWGVVGIVQTPDDLAGMAARIGAPAQAFGDAYWHHRPAYDGGCPTHQYWHAVAADLGVTVDDAGVADLQALDVASWSGVDQQMLDLVGELAVAGHRLALLSNAPADLVGHATQVLDGLVPELFFSSRLGLVKPQPEIFAAALAGLGVPAGEVVFIDDNLDNVRAARDVGMTAIHHLSVEDTRSELPG